MVRPPDADIKAGFEGGQMPLYRRLPKRGFTNVFAKEVAIVSLAQLEKFETGTEITSELLAERGVVSKGTAVKVLANGEIKKAVTVRVEKISAQAKAQIEAAGGRVILFEDSQE